MMWINTKAKATSLMRRAVAFACATLIMLGLSVTAYADALTLQWHQDVTASYAGDPQYMNASIPVGWGYMDPMVVTIPSGPNAGQYALVFYSCTNSNGVPKSFYCVYLTKNGVVASDAMIMGQTALPNGLAGAEAYQPPMLFFNSSTSTIYLAFWVFTTDGRSLVQLFSFAPPGPHWTAVSSYVGDVGNIFNYLGGAMDPKTGDIVIAGYGKRPNARTLELTKVTAASGYTTWAPSQIVTSYPDSPAYWNPVYPHVAIRSDGIAPSTGGTISILAVLSNGAPCVDPGKPDDGLIPTTYKDVVNYEGKFGGAIAGTWSDAAPDAGPDGHGDSCYWASERFPLAHFSDGSSIYSIERATDLTNYDPNNKAGSNAMSNWNRRFKLYKDGTVIVADLGTLFTSYFTYSSNIDAMSMTKLDNGNFVIFANNRGPAGFGLPMTYPNFGVTWSKDLSTFAPAQYIATLFGPGTSVKVTQPNSNGMTSVPFLDLFVSGNQYNARNVNDDHQFRYWRYTLQ